MSDPRTTSEASVETYLVGQIDFAACLALQHRLVFEAGGRKDGQISLLLCEHPPLVTVGRLGSRGHIHLSPRELTSRQLEVRWVNRGGGCLLHAPGQLAVYPIVPLAWHGFSVGEFLGRFQSGILATLAELNVAGQTRAGQHGIWGRSGQLVAFGAAVKSWTTYFGAYTNVDPAMPPFRGIETDPLGRTPASSLTVERRQPVRMATVRATIVRHLATAFGCQRYHLYTGHPLLAQLAKRVTETVPHEL
jgi:lipoyl(octanoyl) transferase